MDFLTWYLLGTSTVLEQICNRPDTFPSDVYSYDLNCKVEYGSYSDGKIPEGNPVVMQYNIKDGTNWLEIAGEIGALPTPPSIIFIDEADRGCDQTRRAFVLKEMAQLLQMDYAYGAEFLEWRDEENNVCTTGNGILSKYPLKNPTLMKFKDQCCWFSGRLGGRSATIADTEIDGIPVNLKAGHLESGTDFKDQLECIVVKTLQARELAKYDRDFEGIRLVGGDFNSPFMDWGGPVGSFELQGYTDAFEKVPFWKRTTDPTDYQFCLDYLLSGDDCLIHPTILDSFGTLSDHYPITAELDMTCVKQKYGTTF